MLCSLKTTHLLSIVLLVVLTLNLPHTTWVMPVNFKAFKSVTVNQSLMLSSGVSHFQKVQHTLQLLAEEPNLFSPNVFLESLLLLHLYANQNDHLAGLTPLEIMLHSRSYCVATLAST